MAEKQTLVVGSGAGGLTLALLLARAGKKVTLIEKQPGIGGYLRRFIRNGMYFDTGYHFSGGFNNVMKQMMQILGIDDLITNSLISNQIVLKSGDQRILLPAGCGHEGAEEVLCSSFPEEADALRKLSLTIREIWRKRQMSNLRDLTPLQMNVSQYDAITVREFCSRLGLSPAVETAAGSFATCHGTPLGDAPMSFHAKVGYSLYESLARPHGGGDTMIRAFRREAEKWGITIRTGAELLRFAEPDSEGNCHEARFADGTSIPADKVFFTIHPLAVRDLLPEKSLNGVFLRRLSRLQETNSFFCAYYLADDEVKLPEGLVSFFSENDLDSILRGKSGYSTGYLLCREPDISGVVHNVITAFRTMPVRTPKTGLPHRERLQDSAYRAFKERIAAEISSDLLNVYPELKGHLHLIETGTPQTCLDYDPPTGSAYGVRCICGQSRICGQLPVNNFYIAGQSASVPGVMGTMITSFIVFRLAMGDEVYRKTVEQS